MPFELRVKEIDEKRLIEITGDKGPFFITGIGGKPELENGFFYGDHGIQFCFYARIKIVEGKKFDIEIFEASNGRFSGATPKSIGSEIDRVEGNITKLFRERSFFNPAEPSSSNDKQNLRAILFTWGVV